MIQRLKKYYISNETGVTQIVTLTEQTSCDGFESVDFSQEIPDGSVTEIKFPNDGTFTVYLDGVDQGVAYYYSGLFESMILFTRVALCGKSAMKCVTTTKCTTEDQNYLNNAISKTLLYYSVNNPKYNDAMDTVLQKIHCSSKTIEDYMRKQEQYLGVSDATELVKIQLAHLYLELFKADSALELPNDREDLEELYDYDAISYCIKKLGVMDCDPPAPLPGKAHETFISALPKTVPLGGSTSVTVSYRFTANDDEFVAVVDTNIPNVNIGKFDGATYNEIITNVGEAESYYITYTYRRGGVVLQNTVTTSITALAPQWFGGETTTADFNNAGKAYVSGIKAAITNVQPVYQSNSNSTSNNSNTVGKYIYWITNVPVKFFIGAFQIPTGPWDNNCDPNSYAIITKTITTVMEDGVTEKVMHYYRTCPLQNLQGQTLTYNIVQ